MAERKAPVEKHCEVKGCNAPAVRSLSAKKASGAGLDVPSGRGNVHLCKEHYREMKKSTREERKLDRLGW